MLTIKSLTKLTLELGGKDAVIVLNDVYNVKEMCSILMRGVFQVSLLRFNSNFQSASQNCIGLEVTTLRLHEMLT